MELQGKIKMISETVKVSEKFRKRELVLTTDDQYPQDVLIEFHQDKCEVLNAYKVNQSVKIGTNLKGREWINPQGEAKYFNTIVGWRIDTMEQATQQPTPATPASLQDEEDDGLPF